MKEIKEISEPKEISEVPEAPTANETSASKSNLKLISSLIAVSYTHLTLPTIA